MMVKSDWQKYDYRLLASSMSAAAAAPFSILEEKLASSSSRESMTKSRGGCYGASLISFRWLSILSLGSDIDAFWLFTSRSRLS